MARWKVSMCLMLRITLRSVVVAAFGDERWIYHDHVGRGAGRCILWTSSIYWNTAEEENPSEEDSI